MHLKSKKQLLVVSCLFLVVGIFSVAHALTPQELQALIDQKKQEKAQLDEENKKLTEQIQTTEAQAQTLSTTVKALDQNAKKLGNDIKTTKTTISKTQLEIQQLSQKISDAETRMKKSNDAITKALQALSETDDTSIFEFFLAGKTMTQVWSETESLNRFNESLGVHVNALDDAKT